MLYKQGKVPGSFYDGRGQEAISVAATWARPAKAPRIAPCQGAPLAGLPEDLVSAVAAALPAA